MEVVDPIWGGPTLFLPQLGRPPPGHRYAYSDQASTWSLVDPSEFEAALLGDLVDTLQGDQDVVAQGGGDVSAPAPSEGGGDAPAPAPQLDVWTSYTQDDVEKLIAFLQHHSTGFGWRTVLNNHTTNRSQRTATAGGRPVGGSIVGSIKDCTTVLSNNPGWVELRIHFPSSLEPGDGVELILEHAASTEKKAMSELCLIALAHLLLRGPYQVTLQPPHWRIHVSEVQAAAAGLGSQWGPDQNAVVVPPSRSGASGAGGVSAQAPWRVPDPGSAAEGEVLAVLREALRRNRGEVDPSRLSRHLFTALRDLLPPRSLKEFIRRQPDQFAIVEVAGTRRWSFRWSGGAAAAPPAAAQRQQAAAAVAPPAAAQPQQAAAAVAPPAVAQRQQAAAAVSEGGAGVSAAPPWRGWNGEWRWWQDAWWEWRDGAWARWRDGA